MKILLKWSYIVGPPPYSSYMYEGALTWLTARLDQSACNKRANDRQKFACPRGDWVEGARTSMCVSLGARHRELDGYALLWSSVRGVLSIFSSRAVWRETPHLSHTQIKLKFTRTLTTIITPQVWSSSPRLRGKEYIMRLKQGISFSPVSATLSRSHDSCASCDGGVLIACHCRGLSLTYCTVYALWMFKWVLETLLNVFLSSVSNVFD